MSSHAEVIRSRLRDMARARGVPAQWLLDRVLVERMLRRLAASKHAGAVALKGAWAFAPWCGDMHRASSDLDLHWALPGSEVEPELLKQAFANRDDGVELHWQQAGSRPRVGSALPGLRMTVPMTFGCQEGHFVFDVGVGHAVSPGFEWHHFPSLLDEPMPLVQCVPRESMLAEKAAVMVEFGADHTRYRDLLDIHTLGTRFSFETSALITAMKKVFARRDAERMLARCDGYWEVAFDERYMRESTRRGWSDMLQLACPITPAPSLRDALHLAGRLLALPLIAIRDGRRFHGVWRAAEGWCLNKGDEVRIGRQGRFHFS